MSVSFGFMSLPIEFVFGREALYDCIMFANKNKFLNKRSELVSKFQDLRHIKNLPREEKKYEMSSSLPRFVTQQHG